MIKNRTNMALYKTIPLITAFVLSLTSNSYAVEDDRYDDHPPTERQVINKH